MSKKLALIIANTKYDDPTLAKLPATGKDAEGLAKILRDPDLAAFDNVKKIIDATCETVRVEILHFLKNATSKDLLLLYFSGHGVRDDDGHLFLATQDTDKEALDAKAIPATYITKLMDKSPSKRLVLILDCCNSGAFDHGTKANTNPSMGTARAFEGNGYGRVVLTASDATQYAYVGDRIIGKETSYSLFTHFLIKGLEGEADHDGDGKITVDEWFDYVSDQIRNTTPKQTPLKFAYRQQEKFVLTTKVRPQTVKPLPLNDPELEEDLEGSSIRRREAAVKELGVILNGSNLGKALTAEQKLKSIIEEDEIRSITKLAKEILNEYQAKRPTNQVPEKPEPPKTEEMDAVAVKPVRNEKENLESSPEHLAGGPRSDESDTDALKGNITLIIFDKITFFNVPAGRTPNGVSVPYEYFISSQPVSSTVYDSRLVQDFWYAPNITKAEELAKELGLRMKKNDKLPNGMVVRLPTKAEYEKASEIGKIFQYGTLRPMLHGDKTSIFLQLGAFFNTGTDDRPKYEREVFYVIAPDYT